MMDQTMSLHVLIVLALVYSVVVLLVWHLANLALDWRIEQRLEAIHAELPEGLRTTRQVFFKGVLERFFEPLVRWSLPSSDDEATKLRLRLTQAGLRSDSALIYFYGLKSLLPVIFLVPFWLIYLVIDLDVELSLTSMAFWSLILLALGYYLPDLFLRHRIAQRQREIFTNFPDALDLIRVCVSAGLGLDSAIVRVGQLIGLQSPALGQDFKLLSLELRAGVAKARALRNLAQRTGLDDVHVLVGMLIQADKFGTSVSESLRVHSESLRKKRRRQAQEAAAKVPVKLTIPMMFCILPALFVVILGPAILDILKVF